MNESLKLVDISTFITFFKETFSKIQLKLLKMPLQNMIDQEIETKHKKCSEKERQDKLSEILFQLSDFANILFAKKES